MLGFITILIIVVTIVLLVAGIIVSKRYASMGILFFFLIFTAKELYLYIGRPMIGNHIDAVIANNGVPMGMTIGEYVAWLSLVPRTLEVIAIGFLVVGLYKLRKLSSRSY